MSLGRFNVSHAPAEDMQEFVVLARRMVYDYHWEDKVVHPYGHAEKVMHILDLLSDYKNYTYDSQIALIDYANGLADIMNKWEETELTGVILVSTRTGRKYKVNKNDVDFYLESGFVKEI